MFVDDQAAIHRAVPADINDIEFDSTAVQMQAFFKPLPKVRTAHFFPATCWTRIDRMPATLR